nr:MAG TPA: hypothetical protein [Caudoviricetes sp.]
MLLSLWVLNLILILTSILPIAINGIVMNMMKLMINS